MQQLIPLIASYILGSIPFGFVAVYLVKRTDIRTLGSGNIGATNVVRVLGKPAGIAVFALDFFKGFFAPLLVSLLVSNPKVFLFILAGLLAVSGHNWSCFLKGKGGKGVATSIGSVCGLAIKFPLLAPVIILSVISWVIVFFISKIVSLASLVAAFSFLVFSIIFYFTVNLPLEFIVFSLLLFVFIVFRHKENIKNLLAKKESHF